MSLNHALGTRFITDDFANFFSKIFFITILPFLLLHRGVQKWSIAKYCPHFSFITLLKAINSPKVTYFSLDIEGAEYDVLKTLDFDKIDISLLGVEIQGMLPDDVLRKNTGSKEQIHNLLKQNGYIYTDRVELDSFFLKK